MTGATVLALVDGEHYPPTTRWALATARAEGYRVAACLLVGGTEKLAAGGELDLGVPVERVQEDLATSLRAAVGRHRPEAVLDLSDEPVLGEPERAVVAAIALSAGVRYLGPDFALEPPFRADPLSVPTMAVIGTGKRTGKTAVAGEAARVAAGAGLDPMIVAMGRGGPPAPQVVEAGSIGLDRLRGLVRAGEHAASDYLEDAVTTGVTTVGARRAGGGLFGGPYVSNVVEAARVAEARHPSGHPPGPVGRRRPGGPRRARTPEGLDRGRLPGIAIRSRCPYNGRWPRRRAAGSFRSDIPRSHAQLRCADRRHRPRTGASE